MKTIYNLTIGDSYYSINDCCQIEEHTIYTALEGWSWNLYQKHLRCDNVFLKYDDAMKKIDKIVALAKINKRASEIEEDYKSDNNWNYYIRKLVIGDLFIDNEVKGLFSSEVLKFKNKKMAQQILKELPNEVKTVLGVD